MRWNYPLALLLYGATIGSIGSILGMAQTGGVAVSDSVRFEVTAEVAASDVEDHPSAIRVELKNVGNSPVDLPMPSMECSGPAGAIVFQFRYEPLNGGLGKGFGCASSLLDGGPFLERVRTEWLRLDPGEYLTFTVNTRRYFNDLGPGHVEYWVEYLPPSLSAQEKLKLRQGGYHFPERLTATSHTTMTID